MENADSKQFKMTVMDSFHSKEFGLIVTGEIESGSIQAKDVVTVKTTNGSFECTVHLVSHPGLKKITVATSKNGYLGIHFKDLKRDDIIRGDVLCST